MAGRELFGVGFTKTVVWRRTDSVSFPDHYVTLSKTALCLVIGRRPLLAQVRITNMLLEPAPGRGGDTQWGHLKLLTQTSKSKMDIMSWTNMERKSVKETTQMYSRVKEGFLKELGQTNSGMSASCDTKQNNR